jgi:hypothetical protein
VVPAYFDLRFTDGPQSLTLSVANSNTTSDSNDFYNALLPYQALAQGG